jgi:hypothetical protein
MQCAVLSPHFDDAVLSCWHVLAQPGALTVVNVFAGAPAPGTAPGWWDRLTGASDPAARVGERAREDRAALALARRTPTNLDLLDAQHRPAAALRPQALAERILPAVAGCTVVYAPAALGSHPDHAVVRDAAFVLRAADVRLRLYADLPHAIVGGWPSWVAPDGDATVDEHWADALHGLGPMHRQVHVLSSAEQRRKRAAIETYGSQLVELERGLGPIERTLGYEVVFELDPA